MSSSTPAAAGASATRCVAQSAFHGRECAGSLDAVDTPDGAGLHRVADVRTTPGPAAVVTGTRPPPAQARITAGLSGHDGGAAVSHDDQAVRGERLQGT